MFRATVQEILPARSRAPFNPLQQRLSSSNSV
jgi:hypothetical protein